MPRLKKGRNVLKGLSELSTIMSVPEAAFAPEPQKLEVPAGAFENVPSRRKGEHPAYVRLTHNNKSGDYATFVFLASFVKKHFKKAKVGDRFELIQGKAPHRDWFMVRPATTTRGNKMISAGVVFHTRYVNETKLSPDLFYPLETIVKDGVLYAKLHPELVPLLR